MPWYFFAFLTPTLFGISNFIDKYVVEKKVRDPWVIVAVTSILAGVLGFILIFILGFPDVGILQTILLIGSGILLVFYLIPYYSALKMDDASRVVPLFQFIPVFSLVLSAVFLKESLNLRQTAGLLVVVFGGLFLSLERVSGKIFAPRKSLWFMLLSGFMYGTVAILFRFVSKDVNFWTSLAYEFMGSGLGGLLLFIFPNVRKNFSSQIQALKSILGLEIINNVLAILAQTSEVYAVTLIAVPFVNVVGGIQPILLLVFGIILSKWFPGVVSEDISRRTIMHKVLAAAVIFMGLYLVYF